jgi:UDP-N-acetyl-D-mannosaminuronate dehydrogenase
MNSGDVRESPALAVAEQLEAMGCRLSAADPHVPDASFPPYIDKVEANVENARLADVILLLTDHDAFEYDSVLHIDTPVLDTRRRCDPSLYSNARTL